MSTDPTGLGNENCMSATSKQYVNIAFDKDLWCEYPGDCKVDNLVFNRHWACVLCRHRKPLDIPYMIDKRIKEKIRRDILKRKFEL